jgi:predicted transcriptional regulator
VPCLGILREKEEVTTEEVKTAKRIALSSMPVSRAEVLSAYRTQPKMSAKEVSDVLDRNYKTMKRHLDQLLHLKVLRSEKDIDGKTTNYFPDPKFERLILQNFVL